MGFLDIFSRKKEPEEEQPEKLHIIDLEKMPDWVQSQFGNEIENAEKRTGELRSDALKSISKTRDNLLGLEKSDFRGKDKTYAAANMAKDSFVKRALSIIDGLRFSGMATQTYSGLVDFHSKISAALKEINKISPKQLFLLSRYFKNESREVMGSIKALEQKTSELNTFLESDGKTIKMTESLNSYTEQMKRLLKQSSVMTINEKGTQAEISKLEDSRKDADTRLNSLLKSRELEDMKDLEDSIQKTKSELAGLETRANNILASAKRPLKKLRHLLESRDAFPDNPFRDIILCGREAWFAGMLESAVEHAKEGKISLKPKEAEKLGDVITSMESEIPKIKERYERLTGQVEENESSIAKFNIKDKRAETEKELREIEEMLKKQWAELDSKIRERKGIEAKILEKKAKAEKLALNSGRKKLDIKLPKPTKKSKQ